MAIAAKLFTTLLRILQALGAIYAVGITSYFIVRVHNAHGTPTNEIYAIEAISGAGFLYSCLVLLLTLCLLQKSGYQWFTIFFDFLFVGGFMAVAILLKGSTKQSCNGLGTAGTAGAAGWLEKADDNTMRNCKLVKGVFGVGVAEAILFLLTLGIAFLAHRQTKADRAFGPSPSNNYTSGWRHRRKEKSNPGVIPSTQAKPQNAKDTAAAAAAGVGGAAASEDIMKNEKDMSAAGREYHRPPVAGGLAAPAGFNTPGRTASPAYGFTGNELPRHPGPNDGTYYHAYNAPQGVSEIGAGGGSYPPRGNYSELGAGGKPASPMPSELESAYPASHGGLSGVSGVHNPNYYTASELDSGTVGGRTSTFTSEGPVSAIEMPAGADRGFGTNYRSGGGDVPYGVGGGEAGHTGNVVDSLPERSASQIAEHTPAAEQKREMHF